MTFDPSRPPAEHPRRSRGGFPYSERQSDQEPADDPAKTSGPPEEKKEDRHCKNNSIKEHIDNVIYDVTCLQKTYKGRTAPGTKCTLSP